MFEFIKITFQHTLLITLTIILLIMKVKDGMIGLIVGDALGVPVEFYSREELEADPVIGMREYGTYNKPAGTWSDDSSMAIATMSSIVNKQTVDYDDIMKEFIQWWQNGKYSQHDTFDIGNTTRNGLVRYLNGEEAIKCGGSQPRDNGNGSLMRILPLAFIPDIDYETVENVSGLTHAHYRSKIACVLYIEIAKSMIKNDLTIDEHIKNSCDKIKEYYKENEEIEHFQRIFDDDWTGEIRSGGYVIDSLESTIFCLKTTDNYRDAVLKAVNLGGDSDTTAAICGGLAGIYYGFDEIPIDWVNTIEYIEKVISLCEKYEALFDEN